MNLIQAMAKLNKFRTEVLLLQDGSFSESEAVCHYHVLPKTAFRV